MWAKLSVPSVLLTTVTYAAKVQQDKQSSFSFSAGEVEKWGGGLFFLNEELNVLDSFVPQGRLGGKYGQYAGRHIKFGGPERYNIISCMSPGVQLSAHRYISEKIVFFISIKAVLTTCCQVLHLNAFLSWSSELVEVQPPMNSAKLGLTLEDNSHEFHFYSRLFCCQKGYSKHGTCIRIDSKFGDPNPDQGNSLISAGWAGVCSWSLALGRAGSTLLLHCSTFMASSPNLISGALAENPRSNFVETDKLILHCLQKHGASGLAKIITMKMQMPDAKTDYDNNSVCSSEQCGAS